jgi:hypothetical protein
VIKYFNFCYSIDDIEMYLPNCTLYKVLPKNSKWAHLGKQQRKFKNTEFIFVEITKNVLNNLYAFIISMEDDRLLWSMINPESKNIGTKYISPHFDKIRKAINNSGEFVLLSI